MTQTLTTSLSGRAVGVGLDFDALYRESRDDLFAYVATMLRDRSAAEEVTSAVFERALRRRTTYSARRGSPRAWLFGIARNAALDELRRRKRLATLAVDPEALAGHAHDEQADRTLTRAVLQRALGALAPREREVIALKFGGGLSNRELARVLGVSHSNAGTLLHRSIHKLRKSARDRPRSCGRRSTRAWPGVIARATREPGCASG